MTSKFYKALIIEIRDEDGNVIAVRESATHFLYEKAARDKYGDKFIKLLDDDNDSCIEIPEPRLRPRTTSY